jgi:hypothetical protein
MQNLISLWDTPSVPDSGSGGYTMYGWNFRNFRGGGQIRTESQFIQIESVRNVLDWIQYKGRIDYQGPFNRADNPCCDEKNQKQKRGANIQLQVDDKTYAHIELQCGRVYSARLIRGYLNRSLDTGMTVSAL